VLIRPLCVHVGEGEDAADESYTARYYIPAQFFVILLGTFLSVRPTYVSNLTYSHCVLSIGTTSFLINK
jgi:hypothetical protein